MFEAGVGSQAEIALTYDFEEAGAAREALDLRFLVRLGGKDLGAAEERLDDTPLVKDEVKGALARLAAFPTAGVVQGSFVVEGTYATTSWKAGEVPGGAGAGGRFRHEGRFQVRVRGAVPGLDTF